jgi:hypothetical protein
MTKSVKRSVLAVVLVALIALVVAAPASALSSTTKQVDPGISVRTIWDNAQVACYKLPDGINHTGNVHLELKFKPNWADFDLYLLNASFMTLSEEMGYMGAFSGKEVLDYRVPRVTNQTIISDPYAGDYMVGDTYYVVVVAFNETADFQVWGYYPQIDLATGPSTTNQWNYYIQSYRKPSDSKKWTSLKGPQYGGPYDFTPTSVGSGEAWLQWPANITNKTVDYDPVGAPSPANMEQYMYSGSNWDTVFEDYGDANWTPPPQGSPVLWYGLRDTFDVEDGGLLGKPGRMMHYTPSLYLVASDAMQGGLEEPLLGKSTMGFKATFVWPENLRISSAPARVKKGAMATFKGTFALNRFWVAGASVKLQKSMGGGVWKTLKTVKTDANGKWTVKVKVSKTTSFRAMATGDPATGLATEYSATKRVSAGG